LNVPRAEETVRMEVADVVVEDSITLVGLGVTVARPDAAVAAMLTVPENPLDPATVIVDVPEIPELTVKDVGLADTVKS